MAKSATQPKCFIIMPITTPPNFVEIYKGDKDHFDHVLEYLFVPALEKAGFKPVPPKAKGSNIIHADIIKQLSECGLVLCDMSILNPNVFYEFGISFVGWANLLPMLLIRIIIKKPHGQGTCPSYRLYPLCFGYSAGLSFVVL